MTSSGRAGGVPRDVELVHEVMQALVHASAVDHTRVRVSAADGVVTVDGSVATHAQRLAVATVVAGVAGVTDVANRLVVDELATDATRAADDELAEAVERAIAESTVAVAGLDVAVRQRVVTVRGQVPSARDRATLRHAVQEVPGVHFVDLGVGVGDAPAPGELEELTPIECLALLAGDDFGRLAVRVGDGVDIFPVNYVVHDDQVYFRSGPGTKLIRLTAAPEVAFEVDGRDGDRAWSVVVKGTAARLDDDEEIVASGLLAAAAAHPTEKLNYVRIDAREVTGRRFVLSS